MFNPQKIIQLEYHKEQNEKTIQCLKKEIVKTTDEIINTKNNYYKLKSLLEIMKRTIDKSLDGVNK